MIGKQLTCIVTSLSSTMTSFVKLRVSNQFRKTYVAVEPCTHKSAPIVALYWLLKRLLTYWFINDVLPTLYESKNMVESLGLRTSRRPFDAPTVAEDNNLEINNISTSRLGSGRIPEGGKYLEQDTAHVVDRYDTNRC